MSTNTYLDPAPEPDSAAGSRALQPAPIATASSRLLTAHAVGPAPIRDDSAAMARIIYLAFIGGFFVPLITLIAVILAYVQKDPAAAYSRHFSFQIGMFWRGLAMLAMAFLFYMILGVQVAVGGGSFLALLLPIGFLAWVVIFTIARITRGLRAVNHGQTSIV